MNLLSRHALIGLALCLLSLGQFASIWPAFAAVDSAEDLIAEYRQPSVMHVGALAVVGMVAAVLAFFRATTWRYAAIGAVALYVWLVWYPEFLDLIVKYGTVTVVSGIIDHARVAGTVGVALLHNVIYPLGYLAILVMLYDYSLLRISRREL